MSALLAKILTHTCTVGITLGNKQTNVATVVVVRLTSCKQGELDAALG